MKIDRAWLNDLMNLLEEGLIAMELKSIRIDELEAALQSTGELHRRLDARIEALEAALREIASPIGCIRMDDARDVARAALEMK